MHKPYNTMDYARLGQMEWGKYDIIRKYTTNLGCLTRCTVPDNIAENIYNRMVTIQCRQRMDHA